MSESLEIFLKISLSIQAFVFILFTAFTFVIMISEISQHGKYAISGVHYPSRKQYWLVSFCIWFYPILPILWLIYWDKPFKNSEI